MPYGATQDEWVMVERSTGEGNGKPLQYYCFENPMNSMKRQEDRTLKDELSRSVGAQYATGDQRRNNSRKNDGTEAKQKQNPVMGDKSKGEKERYTHLNAEFQRIARRDKKAFLNERLEISSRKLEIPREHFMQRWAQ